MKTRITTLTVALVLLVAAFAPIAQTAGRISPG
jgi:hypothetical protein